MNNLNLIDEKGLNDISTLLRLDDKRPYKEREASLIEGVKAGDHCSFNEIFEENFPRVYRLAHKLLGNSSDAEDVVQEVFLLVYRKTITFEGKSDFSTWLYRLTANTALSRLREIKKYRKVFVDEYLPQFNNDGHHKVRPVADWSLQVDKLVSDKQFSGLIHEAIDQLKPLDKAVIVMSDLEEMTNREIGDALGLSLQAVKSRLHRARLFLRGKLAVHLGYSPT